MSQISFVKMSGAGNDFIIVDTRTNNRKFSPEQITKISTRNNIGCDQFILLKNSSSCNVFMDIYNSDGSASKACGNATRCVASIIMKENNLNEIQIETQAGILPCKIQDDLICVNMGKPQLSWQKIPLSKEMDTNSIKLNGFTFSAVNMGNPHIVTFLDKELTDIEFFKIAPQLENHHLFPSKTNVEFVQIISPNHLKARVWERGSGETLSCGSGACAIAVAALKNNITNNDITISFKGGDIGISINKNDEVIMKGDARTIFYGIINNDFLETN
jgi:diaminopimelate epimerase